MKKDTKWNFSMIWFLAKYFLKLFIIGERKKGEFEVFVYFSFFISIIQYFNFIIDISRDAADNVIERKGKFEELVVASHEIAASTAQLVNN